MFSNKNQEFDKRLAQAMKEATSARKVVRVWGGVVAMGALCSVIFLILLILHLFKKV